MQLPKFIICFCCAGLVLLTGCAPGGEQTQAVNSPTGAVSPASGFTVTARPGASNTLKNTPTPVKPTNPYTSREPYYTFNPPTPTPTPAPPAPVIAGAEFLKPSDEEIAELKKEYKTIYEKLSSYEKSILRDAIISFDNACVGYDFSDYVFRDYDWSKGIPSAEDVRAYMSENTDYKKGYRVPIYSKDYKLIAYMKRTCSSSGIIKSDISFAKDDYLDYWEEMYYCIVLPMHTTAYYAYMRINPTRYSENIQDMMLISEGSWNYSYLLVETDKGSYVFNRLYEDELAINVSKPALLGCLYTNQNINMFYSLYMSRLDNPRFSDSGLAE